MWKCKGSKIASIKCVRKRGGVVNETAFWVSSFPLLSHPTLSFSLTRSLFSVYHSISPLSLVSHLACFLLNIFISFFTIILLPALYKYTINACQRQPRFFTPTATTFSSAKSCQHCSSFFTICLSVQWFPSSTSPSRFAFPVSSFSSWCYQLFLSLRDTACTYIWKRSDIFTTASTATS